MYVFDGPNKLIFITTNTFEFDAQDIYSEWKRWLINDSQNSTYDQAFRSIGGESISNVKTIAPYIELLNNWRIKPWDGDYTLTVLGNLFATGGLNPFISANGNILLSLETTGNALALDTGGGSGGSGASASDIWNYPNRTSTDPSDLDLAHLQAKLDTLQSAIEFAIDNQATINVVDTTIMQTGIKHKVKYDGAHLVFNK